MNHDVGSAELLGRYRQRCFERRRRAHVRDRGVIARGAGIDIEPRDARAFSLESRDDRGADPAGRAGHQRDTPAQLFQETSAQSRAEARPTQNFMLTLAL